jgi:hypothetical protein
MMNHKIVKATGWSFIVLLIAATVLTTIVQCSYEGYGKPLMECYDAVPREQPSEMALLDGFLLINSKKEFTPTRHVEAVFHYSIPAILSHDHQHDLMTRATLNAPCKVTTAMLNYCSNPDTSISTSDLFGATNAMINLIETESLDDTSCVSENISKLKALQN